MADKKKFKGIKAAEVSKITVGDVDPDDVYFAMMMYDNATNKGDKDKLKQMILQNTTLKSDDPRF